MGSIERRKRDQAALRGRILDAARTLFAQSGYEAVTMRRIAGLIDYSPTTIYLHFRDKDALIRELCSEDFLSLAAQFRAARGREEPLERIQAIGQAFLGFALSHPNHYRAMFLAAHPPVPADQRRIERGNLEEDAWAILVSAVAEAQEAGSLRRDLGNAEELAQQFFAGIHGVASLHLVLAEDPWIGWAPVESAGERMIEALLRGFAPPPGGAPVPGRRP